MVAVARQAASQQPKDRLTSNSAFAGMRLLVVDDHPAVRMCLRDLLEDQPDFTVVDTVSTAEEALFVAGRKAIDVAIVDYQLDGRNGLWASRKLKRLPRPPRVVIYSAYCDGVLAAASVVAEADGMIGKGALGFELCDAIRGVARGRLLLPMIPLPLAEVTRRWLDAEEQAIFSMRLAGIAPAGIASRLGVSAAELESRPWDMLSKLEALGVALAASQSGRPPDDDQRLVARRTAA